MGGINAMRRKKSLSEIAQDVVAEYRRLGSLKAVAATLQISESKVRKILITENEIEFELLPFGVE